jgi:hypothetical protein
MYIIHLKGKAAPIEVERTQGDAIKRIWGEDPKSENPIEVKDRMFRISQINSIEPVQASKSDREPEPPPVPLTQEQQEKLAAFTARMREELKERGILKEGKTSRRYDPDVVWHKLCQVCGDPNPPGCARVCSGKCYLESPLLD